VSIVRSINCVLGTSKGYSSPASPSDQEQAPEASRPLERNLNRERPVSVFTDFAFLLPALALCRRARRETAWAWKQGRHFRPLPRPVGRVGGGESRHAGGGVGRHRICRHRPGAKQLIADYPDVDVLINDARIMPIDQAATSSDAAPLLFFAVITPAELLGQKITENRHALRRGPLGRRQPVNRAQWDGPIRQ
jgi:hypothetical protein